MTRLSYKLIPEDDRQRTARFIPSERNGFFPLIRGESTGDTAVTKPGTQRGLTDIDILGLNPSLVPPAPLHLSQTVTCYSRSSNIMHIILFYEGFNFKPGSKDRRQSIESQSQVNDKSSMSTKFCLQPIWTFLLSLNFNYVR